MIDIKQLREDSARFIRGAQAKGIEADIPALLELDRKLLAARQELQDVRTAQNVAGKSIAKLTGDAKAKPIAEMKEAKDRAKELSDLVAELEPKYHELLLQVPQPPDDDVPVGKGVADNVEIRRWSPSWFDPARPFAANKGFAPKTHMELGEKLGLIDFARGVKMAGARSYVLTGRGMLLHQAVLRCAFDFMACEQGFVPVSVPVLVREEMMVGTGFFPFGKDQAYEIRETDRGGGDPQRDRPRLGTPAQNLYLTGTGEVGLMGLHAGEILDGATLPRRYVTVSTCFRREAGAAGKDTAGLYRIHQFDKVEQVVLCHADEQESRDWHRKMIGFVETLMQRLELPYRLIQCCTAELGPKNADMVDIETWMPSRGPTGPDGRAAGEYGETHSASRLYDYQCRRLDLRYRDSETHKVVVCHSLNNTVIASPRILIPILELYQNADSTVTVPAALRPYLGGLERIEPVA
ncbi:MAG: serine--tRNA ligase [Phycisphaerae bacterium]|nr:serine--tRNA ligase [Phycisphaerae bacterium]